jgi:hypothetical protein
VRFSQSKGAKISEELKNKMQSDSFNLIESVGVKKWALAREIHKIFELDHDQWVNSCIIMLELGLMIILNPLKCRNQEFLESIRKILQNSKIEKNNE